MNESQIEAMERKLQEMQEQLKAMKEERTNSMFPAMLPDGGKWFLSQNQFLAEETWHKEDMSARETKDQNIFPSKEIAETYGDAFRVMLELRRCEGAGHYFVEYGMTYGWSIDADGLEYFSNDYPEMFAFFPPFPTEELAQSAIDNVGKERIIAAMKLLANVED